MAKRNSETVVETPKRAKKAHLQGILKKDLNRSSIGSPNRTVTFRPPDNLQDTLKNIKSGEIEDIQAFLSKAENLKGDELVLWLKELEENIKLINVNLELFVTQLLGLPWYSQGTAVVEAYKNFLMLQVSAHPVYTELVLSKLMVLFRQAGTSETPEGNDFTAEETEMFAAVHSILKGLLEVAPLCTKNHLLKLAESLFPFYKHPAHRQACYVTALLEISTYIEDEEARDSIFQIIFSKVIAIDAYCPREHIDECITADDKDEKAGGDKRGKTKTVVRRCNPRSTAYTLDVLMSVLFEFVKKQSTKKGGVVDSEKLSQLFTTFMKVFDSHVIPSFRISHVQFLFFYMAGLDSKICKRFLEFNWRKFNNPNTAAVLRQNAMSYIACLISRALFVGLPLAQKYMEKISAWIQSYLKTRESVSNTGLNYLHTDIKAHGPFYYACQGVLLIFVYRHKELTAEKSGIKFLKDLSLQNIVSCGLNPLRVCQDQVVSAFSSLTRNYQLAYCQTIIERNRRNVVPVAYNIDSANIQAQKVKLEPFFPFDPYLLPQSSHWVENSTRAYVFEGSDGHDHEDVEGEDDLLDFEDMDDSCVRRRRDSTESVRSNQSGRSRSNSLSLPDFLFTDHAGPGLK